MDEAQFREMYSGKAGEPVPEVDPGDLKAVWELAREVKERHPEGGVAIGVDIYEQRCKPAANIPAVTYRASMLGMLCNVAPVAMNPLIQDRLDAVLRTAAQVPMEWIGQGVRKGWPFDPDDFVRRVREAS